MGSAGKIVGGNKVYAEVNDNGDVVMFKPFYYIIKSCITKSYSDELDISDAGENVIIRGVRNPEASRIAVMLCLQLVKTEELITFRPASEELYRVREIPVGE